MKNLKNQLLAPMTFCTVMICAVSVRAINVNPGDSLSISGTTELARPELAGPIIADVFIPFSFTDTLTGGLISGTLQNRVVQEASGTLDIYYRVIQDPNSGGPVGAVRTSGFDLLSTDCDFRLDGSGTVAPINITRFSGIASGDLNFSFTLGGGAPVLAGESSYFMFIKTTATSYDQNGLTDISADFGAGLEGISLPLMTFEPATVPEPSTLALLAIGSLAMYRLIRRKN
jgi:hypothetical protein